MEMEFSEPRRRRLLLVVGIVLAVVAGAVTFVLAGQPSTNAEPLATRQILVAAQTIPARTVIEPGYLAVRNVPDDPSLALAISDPLSVQGLVTAVTIYADQPITPNLIATSAAGEQFAILSPTETISPYSPTWRAVSLPVIKERAVGGLISAGQRVDVIATVPIGIKVENENGELVEGTTLDGFYTDESTKVTLSDIEVLAKDVEGDVYVLKVNLHQAEELAALATTAQFTLAMRPQGDNRIVDRAGYGETLNRVVEEYGYPLPQVIQVDRYRQPDAEIVPEGSPTVAWPEVDPGASLEPADPLASPEPSASSEPTRKPKATPAASPLG